jgi:hypothetical protein
MATLIQSKQIQGIVTASVIEGNFSVQGQIIATGSDSVFGAITASAISSSGPIYGVRYSDIQGTPNFIGGSGLLITQVGSTITITNTGGGEGVSGSAELISSVAQLSSYTGSNDIIILGLQSQIDALIAQTGSYETKGRGIISGSDQLTSSFDTRYALSGSVGGGISSWNDLTDIPSGLISSSEQILGGTGILSGSHIDISSLNQYTASTDETINDLQSRINSLTSATSSYIQSPPSIDSPQLLSIEGNQLTISNGNTITIPTGSSVGSSVSVSDTPPNSPSEGDLWWKSDEGNLYVYYDGYWVISVDNTSSIPLGTVSGSSQLTSSLDERYALSGSVGEGGGDITFDGNRIVSNTLLGDLYSQSFNAGTSGSIQEFLNAVFFPQTAPTAEFTDQTNKFNTNLATNGTNLVSVSLTDTVDNSPYTLVLTGTNASSLIAVPTNSDSSSWEIRANGDLTAGTYSYNVVVGDSTEAERTYSGRSIVINQASVGNLSTNGTFYIIESATSGVITLSSTGRPGSTAGVSVSYSPNYGTQVATNFQSSNPLISINSTSGLLSVGSPISGSGNLGGSIISSSISWEDQYGNNGSGSISVNITQNSAPTRSGTTTTNNNTNQATGSAQIIRLTVTDTEGDTMPNDGLTWVEYNSTYFSASVSTPFMYLYANNTSIPAGTYPYTASFRDIHGFRTSSFSSSVVINQADNGTLDGDINNYIIESALSGAVLRDSTGFNNGNPSQVSVSYSPNYGSQSVQSFTSSNPAIGISSTGHLTLAVDLSGSVTQSGATINSVIGWTDQYGNNDSSSITATVFGNNAPAVSFTNNGLNDLEAISGSNVASFTITDTESNSPFSASIGGTDGGLFNLVPQNINSSSYQIQPTGSLPIGTYSVQVLVQDSYSETTILNQSISVVQSLDYGKVYIYTSTRTASGTLSTGNYLSVQGASGVNSDVPPLVTSFTADTTSPFYLLSNGSMGNSSISVGGGTLTLRNAVSGSDLRTIVSESFDGSNGTETFMIIFPSGSDMIGTPTSMTDTLGGSTSGQYVMYVKTSGEGSFTVRESTIHAIELAEEHLGFDKWNIIGRTGTHATTNYEIKFVPSSGSAP